MEWLTNSILYSIAGSIILFGIFLYIYKIEQKAYFKYWTWGWAFYFFRFLSIYLHELGISDNELYYLGAQLFSLISLVFLLWGALLFVDSKPNHLWLVFPVLLGFWTIFAFLRGFSTLLISSPNHITFGALYTIIGIIFFRRKDWPGLERRILGIVFILWGLHKMNYPFLRQNEILSSWGYLLGAFFSIFSAIWLVVTYLRITWQRLQVSEKKYRDIVHTAQTAIITLDLKGNITFVNEYTEALFGFTWDEIRENNLFNTIIPKVNSEGINLQVKFIDFLTHKTNYNVIECECITKDNKHLWVSWKTKTLTNEKNETVGFLSAGTDITRRHKIEKQLMHETLIDETVSGLSKEILAVNLSIQKISELIYKAAIELTESNDGLIGYIEPETDDLVSDTFSQVRDDLSNGINESFRLKKQGDSYPTILGFALNERKGFLTNNPSEYDAIAIDVFVKGVKRLLTVPAIAQNELIGQITVINSKRDYTKDDMFFLTRLANLYALAILRKQMENDLIKTKNKAEESDRLKSAFLTNMSHEIRTPMNGIIGFSDLLASQDLSSELRQNYAGIIKARSRDLLQIIDDILDLSKIEAGQLQLNKKPFALNTIISQLILTFTERMTKEKITGISLETSFEFDDGDDELVSDPIRIKQILSNLIDNAIKFTEKGKVEVGYTKKGTEIIFYVNDTGIGIEKAKTKVIFERFRQADETLTRRFGGNGLGLSISKQLVELLGGKIWLDSEINKGSTFYFSIPLIKNVQQKSPEMKTAKNEPEFKPKSHDKKQILIVEDDEPSVFYLTEILNALNVDIKNVGNGQAALDITDTDYVPDLILMDVQLPVMNGLECTEKMRAKGISCPIIAQTAYAMIENKDRCLEAGCNDYITKPIIKEKLLQVVYKYL